MSNFIDHWLNSTPIEEATRAKKLKKQGKISPEDYAKAEQSLEQKLSKYVTDDPEKMHYITFISEMTTAKELSDDDIPPPAPGEVDIRRRGRKKSPPQTKVGINPYSRYDTPNGIYTYPLTPYMFGSLVRGRIGGHGFAQNQPFIALLKPKDSSKILQIEDTRFATDDPLESPYLKRDIVKLFKKDSPIRLKLRDSKIDDYERGTRLVHNIEHEIIVDKVAELGIIQKEEFDLNHKIMSDGFEKLALKRRETDGDQSVSWKQYSSIATAYAENESEIFEYGFTPMFNMKSFINALVLDTVEINSKAMSHFKGMEYHDLHVLLNFFDSVFSNTEKYNFVDSEGFPTESSHNFRSRVYLTDCVIMSLIKGFASMLTHTAAQYSNYLPNKEMPVAKAHKYKTMVKDVFMDLKDAFSNAYKVLTMARKNDNLKFLEVETYNKSVFKEFLATMFRELTRSAKQMRFHIKKLLDEDGYDYPQFNQLSNFILFSRSLFHPTRLFYCVKRAVNAAVYSGFKPHMYTLKTYRNFLQDNDLVRLGKIYLDTESLSQNPTEEEIQRNIVRLLLVNSVTFKSSFAFWRDYGEFAELLLDANIDSSKETESFLSTKEKDFLRSATHSGTLTYYPDSANREIVNSIVEKLYDPTAEELLRTPSIKRIIEDARNRTIPSGILWNITRHLAGLQSYRVLKKGSGSKGFKRVPALWNTIWRYLGYDGATDLLNTGTIHPAEKTQAVFYNRAFIDVVEVFTNTLKAGRQEKDHTYLYKVRAAELCVKNLTGKKIMIGSVEIDHLEEGLKQDTALDDKYTSVIEQFKNIKTFEDAKKMINNKELADLVALVVWSGFDLFQAHSVFNMYAKLIPPNIRNMKAAGKKTGRNLMEFDFITLLVSFLTGKEYYPYFGEEYDRFYIETVGKDPRSYYDYNTGNYLADDIRTAFIPMTALKVLIDKHVSPISYTDEEIANRVLKIDGLHKITMIWDEPKYQHIVDTISSTIKTVIDKQLDKFIKDNEEKIPDVAAQVLSEFLQNTTVRRSLEHHFVKEAEIPYTPSPTPMPSELLDVYKNMYVMFSHRAQDRVRYLLGKRIPGTYDHGIDFHFTQQSIINYSPVIGTAERLQGGEAPESLMRAYIDHKCKFFLTIFINSYTDTKWAKSSLPPEIEDMDFYNAYKGTASQTSLQEVDRLITEMEMLLHG